MVLHIEYVVINVILPNYNTIIIYNNECKSLRYTHRGDTPVVGQVPLSLQAFH